MRHGERQGERTRQVDIKMDEKRTWKVVGQSNREESMVERIMRKREKHNNEGRGEKERERESRCQQ